MNELIVSEQSIQRRIFTIRGQQVMLDEDLAKLYQVETRTFNQAVKRNIKRFPERFRFQLTEEEYKNLTSQFVTSSSSGHGGRRHLPYAFTEQGVSMLNAVLKSDVAIEVSIKIIEAFVAMRRLIASNTFVYERFERIEQRLSKYDENFDILFKALEDRSLEPRQGIFFDGQIFDAYEFVAKLVKSTLTLFSKNQNVDVTIYTKSISKQLQLDLKKYNAQYRPITVKLFKEAHDRFMINDRLKLYHIGASLKDLGKKWFAFSRMDMGRLEMLGRLK